MNNLFDIENKVFLITGAGSGLGKVVSDYIYEHGGKVYRGIHKIKKLKNKHDYELFVEDFKSRNNIISKIRKKESKLDVLINMAGISNSGHGVESWNKTLNINLSSVFFLSELVKNEFMIHQGFGNIINVSSICSHLGFSNNPSYNVSKAGIISLTKSLAKDWSRYNIRINAITPGYFKTKMTEKSMNDHVLYNQRCQRILLGRYADPEEIIGPIIFLASEASKYITGTEIIVDGGFLANGI